MLALLIAAVSLAIVGLIAIAITIVALLVYDKISSVPLIYDKVDAVEKNLNILASMMVEGNMSTPRFRTADGKHEGDTIEEVVSKMVNDPESELTEEDIETLKKIFEQIIDQESDE